MGIHAHKSTVMDCSWNKNGNWLLTASRDHLLELFDIRNLKEEMQTFRGHKKEVSCVQWHPVHEGMFASGGNDGSIMYWNVGETFRQITTAEEGGEGVEEEEDVGETTEDPGIECELQPSISHSHRYIYS